VQLDVIQLAALSEGICLPNHTSPLRSRLHVYSKDEAIQCLSPAYQNNKPIRLVISGDSYNRALFIGMTDILLGDPSNEELYNERQRNLAIDHRGAQLLAQQKASSSSFPSLIPICWNPCMGQSNKGHTFQSKCHWCVNGYTNASHIGNPKSETSDDVMYTAVVVGASVHIWKALGGKEAALNDIKEFLNRAPRILFNTMPAYQLGKVPKDHRKKSHHSNFGFYRDLIEWHKEKARPTLDFFAMTAACMWSNCTADGGHRSRFVNRWKAQLLLNAICDYHEGTASPQATVIGV
jgi:hypothetical protein